MAAQPMFRWWRGAAPIEEFSAGRTRGLVFTLMLVSMFNLMDRQILSILLVPIQNELGASDTQMGLVTGFAFSVFYLTASVPVARWADVGNRRNLIVVAMTVWSGATIFCGGVASYFQLLLLRIGVAGGEAAAQPAALSMISDVVPQERRGAAIGVYYFGAALGIATGYLLAGVINEHYGWRAAFVAFGAPGLLVALLIWLTIPEPRRGVQEHPNRGVHREAAEDQAPPFAAVLKYLLTTRTCRLLLIALSLQSMFTYMWMVWAPAFMMRIHGLDTGYVGWWLGLTFGVSAGLGSLVGGRMGDRVARRYGLGGYSLLCSVVLFASVPFALTFIFAPSSTMAFVAFFLVMLLVSCVAPATFSLWMALVHPRTRAVTTAVTGAATILVGLGLGPVVIGVLNDQLAPFFGKLAIRYSFLASIVVATGAAFWNWRAGRSVGEGTDAARMQDFGMQEERLRG